MENVSQGKADRHRQSSRGGVGKIDKTINRPRKEMENAWLLSSRIKTVPK